MITKLALRQVLRYWRPSLGALLSASVGVAAIIFMGSVMHNLQTAVISSVVDMRVGSIVVQRRDFMRDGVEDWSRTLDATLIEGAPRLVFEGMLSNGEASANVRVIGIDPEKEALVCPLRHEMEPDGPLTREDEVLVGMTLAKRISHATTLSATRDGRQNALDITVKGRTDALMPFANDRWVTVPIAHAQKLLGLEGRASEIALRVEGDPAPVAEQLRRKLGPDYEVQTWREREPRQARFVGTIELLALAMAMTLSVLVLGFVMNATRAAVEERRREIGTMLALGVRRRQVLQLFLVEAAAIATAAAVLGTLLGALACALAAQKGLHLRAPNAKPFIIRPNMEWADVAFASALIIGGALLAAYWPARVASKVSPIDALRED